MRTRHAVSMLGALAMALMATTAAHGHDASAGDGYEASGTEVSAAATERAYSYEIQTRGTVHSDPGAFAWRVADILGDARGWTLGGSVAFQEVDTGGELNVILASPQAVENAAPVCSRYYSCRVGDSVYINDRNWRESTPAFREAGGDIHTYREYLINHEVGHFLGFGHYDCGTPGNRAPVMQQQSIDLQGCEPAGWPSNTEREMLGDRLGVAVHDDWYFTDVLIGDVHQEDVHAVADAEVAAGFPDGTFRPQLDVTRGQMAAFLARALDLEAEEEVRFEDVPEDHAHAEPIAAVDEHEIVSGYDDETFGPDAAVTRAQMATMLARAYDLEAEDEPEFTDVDADHTHAEGVAAVTEAGIAEGYDDDTYRPAEHVTRAQMAAFLARAGLEG